MPIFGQIAVAIILNVVSSLLMAALAKKPEKPQAGSLDVPRATEGVAVTEVFGTILIKNPTVVWYGAPYTVAIKSKGGKK